MNKEAITAYRNAEQNLHEFCEWFNVPRPNNYQLFLDSFNGGNFHKEDILKINEIIKRLFETALQDDTNLYEAVKIGIDLGLHEEIKARMKQGITVEGQPYYDLLKANLYLGNTGEINSAISDYHRLDTIRSQEADCNHGINKSFTKGKVEKVLREVYKLMTRFINTKKLPNRTPNLGDINFAINSNYDLVIGVLNGCTFGTNAFEASGKRIRYIEYHKHWEKKPIWKQIGNVRERITRAKKVLICENDAVTGTTLINIMPKIDELNPEKLDIYFCGALPTKSLKISEELGYFDSIFTNGYDQHDKVYSNLLKFRRNLKRQVLTQSGKQV